MAQEVIQNTNTNFTEETNSIPKSEDIENLSPDALMNRPQTNTDRSAEAQQQKQEQPVQQEPKKPSAAPVIILIVLLVIGLVVGLLLVLRNKRAEREAAENERIRQEQQRLLEEEEQRELEELEKLNADKEVQDKVRKLEEDSLEVDSKIKNALKFYTKEEREKLLMMGLTVEDIVTFAEVKVPFDEAYSAIDSKIKEYMRNSAKKVAENAEGKDGVLQWTNFVQPKNDAVFDTTKKSSLFEDRVPYEKVPSYGTQLYLKLYVGGDDTSEFVLYNCDPVLYNAIRDKGETGVKYRYREIPNNGGFFYYDITLVGEILEQQTKYEIEHSMPME